MVRRAVVLFILTLALMGAAALPAAAAANARASCVGILVSIETPPDVTGFKAIAAQFGLPNFGTFVAGGAGEHLGSVAACLPT
jgi:hypothetical protein